MDNKTIYVIMIVLAVGMLGIGYQSLDKIVGGILWWVHGWLWRSHATKRGNVIPRQIIKEVGCGFVANRGFEDFLLTTDGQPLLSFKGTRGQECAPVDCHSFGIIIDEI